MAFVLVPNSSGEIGDIGTVYVAAIPLDEQNPVLEAQLDTSAGEFTFGWEDIADDGYVVVAYTNKANWDGICVIGLGDMCGIYGDAIEFVDNDNLLGLRPTGPATPAELYMYFIGVGAAPALLTQSEWEEIMERIPAPQETRE